MQMCSLPLCAPNFRAHSKLLPFDELCMVQYYTLVEPSKQVFESFLHAVVESVIEQANRVLGASLGMFTL